MENIFIRSNYFSNQSTKHNAEKTSKFEWMLDDTRIEKIISDPIWATFFSFLFFFFFFFFLRFQLFRPNLPLPLATFFSWVLPLPVVRPCSKLSSYAISSKTYEPIKLDFGPFSPNLGDQLFQQVLSLLDVRIVATYHCM